MCIIIIISNPIDRRVKADVCRGQREKDAIATRPGADVRPALRPCVPVIRDAYLSDLPNKMNHIEPIRDFLHAR